jgi:hypothetical protein
MSFSDLIIFKAEINWERFVFIFFIFPLRFFFNSFYQLELVDEHGLLLTLDLFSVMMIGKFINKNKDQLTLIHEFHLSNDQVDLVLPFYLALYL